MNKKESLKDTARVLGSMYDAIEFRGFDQEDVDTLEQYSGVPVWNGLTDMDHLHKHWLISLHCKKISTSH